MATPSWPTKPIRVASLHLDEKNPRLGRETLSRAPREIIQYLFEHDRAMDLAASIATRGFFPNEPLLAIKENNRFIVIEGNRRLAALKALREPGLLEGNLARKVERLSRRIDDLGAIAVVPVTLAPSRKATDRQIVGRHIGTPVRPWQAENRASFILDKLAEGYDNDELRDVLGFTLTDIQKARQTRAIADMARSVDLPDEVIAKLGNPRAKIFTTLERVFDSSVGRGYLKVEPDSNHGLRGNTTKGEFVRGFAKLVTDVALGKQSSRTLNTNENIQAYFNSWHLDEIPKIKRGSFIPSDIIQGTSVASSNRKLESEGASTRSKRPSKTVFPSSLKIRTGNERLIDIRGELIKLNREQFPNAGVILLRVFFELVVIDYLSRTGELAKLVQMLGGKGQLRHSTPTMKQLVPAIIEVARRELPSSQLKQVEKALRYDASAPFTISDLHSFVHQPAELPGPRDILQFWLRVEPVFRLMLEK